MVSNAVFSDPSSEIADHSPEVTVLLLAARNPPDVQALDALQSWLSRPLDWSRLLFLARRNGVSPLLYQTLQRLRHLNIPDDLLQSLASESSSRTFSNLMRARQLLTLMQGLTKAGILAIPFKGPVLAQTAYGDISLRTFADLDIWVAPREIDVAEAWLQEQGFELRYRLQWESLFRQTQTGLNVDLHHAITSEKFPIKLTFEQVAARLQPLMLAGHTLLHLSPEDTLFVQCIGWCKDASARKARLAQLCDVAGVLQSHPHIDWVYLTALARKIEAQYILLLPLSLASDWLGAPLPEAISKQIQALPQLLKLQKYASEQFWQYAGEQPVSQNLSTRDHTFYFGLRSGFRARCIYLFRQIFIPTEKEKRMIIGPMARIPGMSLLLRLIRLVGKYGGYLFTKNS
jgi:hypothetical protein